MTYRHSLSARDGDVARVSIAGDGRLAYVGRAGGSIASEGKWLLVGPTNARHERTTVSRRSSFLLGGIAPAASRAATACLRTPSGMRGDAKERL